MKQHKKLSALLISAAMLVTSVVTPITAFGANGFSDVAENSWYSEAVSYVGENQYMSGISDTEFGPNISMSRAMLAAVLYRVSGSPSVEETDVFSDVPSGVWYNKPIAWVSENNIVNGYGNGFFGADDPVTREQLASILWRYEGSPMVGRNSGFSDENMISAYASTAVAWARENGIINGRGENSFAPKETATRAEVAVILHNYLTMEPIEPEDSNGGSSAEETNGKTLIAYFTVPERDGVDAVASASRVVENGEVLGNLAFVAQVIKDETNGDLFAIETVQQYPGTHEDLLDFAAEEMDNNERPELSAKIENLDEYDTVFIGYPIWNADLPMPMYTFFETYDFSGKTIIPFTVHGGSGFAGTIRTISGFEPNADIIDDGFSVSRNNVSQSREDIIDWVKGLGFTKEQPETNNDINTSDLDMLVAYFSYTGNTREVAEYISEQLDADLFEIETAEPYESSNLAERAERERDSNARPELSGEVENMDDYEVIFIGYPIWYYTAPMAVGTFLESYDLDDKVIVPFCTSASSDIDVSLDFINSAVGDAVVLEGLTANGSENEIDNWLAEILSELEEVL